MLSLFAEVDLFDKLINFGGLGVCVLLLYRIHLAALESLHAELKEERTRHAEEIREERQLFREVTNGIISEMKAMVQRMDKIEDKVDELPR